MKFLFAALLWMFLGVSAVAEAGFRIDLTAPQVLRLEGKLHVADLAPGERAELHWLGLCSKGGELWLPAEVELAPRPNSALRSFMMRLPDGEAAITIAPTDRTARRDLLRRVQRFDPGSCEAPGRRHRLGPALRVVTINGERALSGLLRSPLFDGVFAAGALE